MINRRYIRRAAYSILLSILITSVIALILTNTVPVGVWNETLQTQRFENYYWQVTEGTSWNRLGTQGLSGIDDVLAVNSPLVCLYGDSIIEGFNVPDNLKTAQRLTAYLDESPDAGLTAVSFGRQGSTGADHYWLMRRVEELPIDSRIHIVTFTDVSDFLPGFFPANTGYARYLSEPELEIAPSLPPSDSLRYRFRTFLYKDLKQNWIYYTRENIKYITGNLRFAPGPPPREKPQEPGMSAGEKSRGFRFFLEALAKVTDDPTVFIYIPNLPTLENNQVQTSENRADVDMFFELAQQTGFGTLDMTESFVSVHNNTGEFVHGFQNSIPGEGHINRYGHDAVAEEIYDYIESELSDAF